LELLVIIDKCSVYAGIRDLLREAGPEPMRKKNGVIGQKTGKNSLYTILHNQFRTDTIYCVFGIIYYGQ
jgi:hypothetical protein